MFDSSKSRTTYISADGIIKDTAGLKGIANKKANFSNRKSCNSTLAERKFSQRSIIQKHFKIAVVNFGKAQDIIPFLNGKGCDIRIFSTKRAGSGIDAWNPDGILLSDGPGNPEEAFRDGRAIMLQSKFSGLPVFGTGLGHQLMALDAGFLVSEKKAKYQGIKQPVKNLINQQIRTVHQNHIFSVYGNYVGQENAEITHLNINDRSVEGLRFKDYTGFSLQYHPRELKENFLFDHFIDLIRMPILKERKAVDY